jgi:hypothetical protein
MMSGTRNIGGRLNTGLSRERWLAAAVALSLVLAVPCFNLRAEMLFRSLEQANGQQGSSPIRKYSNPSDVAYARGSASSAAARADEVRAFLSGEITRADVDSAEVMVRLLKSGKQKLAGNTVWLASNGGDIDAAMDLGRLLRDSGIFTLVGKTDQCLSACVFAFMGGERRSVAGRLGIHRPYFPYTQDSPDRQSRFRHLQRTLKAYVEEMDFPSSLYEAVMLVPPETMKFLAPAELKSFYLEGISPSSEDRADAAAARRLDLTMFEYLKYKAKAPACAFLVGDPDRCEGKAQDVAASGGAADVPGSAPKAEAARTRRAVGRDVGTTPSPGSSRGTPRGAPGSS